MKNKIIRTKDAMHEDEIDLRELFETIWNKKVFILIIVFIVTSITALYVNIKNYTPIYQGKMLIEIGEVLNKYNEATIIDNPYNLKEIIIKNRLSNEIAINIPKRTNNLVEVLIKNKEKDYIKKSLEKVYSFTLKRHKEKTKYYDKIIDSKMIGNIEISKNPINKPKKKLIIVVSFISSLIISIFLIFVIQFFRNIKKEN